MSQPQMGTSRSHAPMTEVKIVDFADTHSNTTTPKEAGRDTCASESKPTSAKQHGETKGSNTIIFKTHDGHGYVLPLVPWESTKAHIEDIYRLRYDDTLAEAVKEGRFSLMTEDANIILPSVWMQVVTSAATVQIVLSLSIPDPNVDVRFGSYGDDLPRFRSRRHSPTTLPSRGGSQISDVDYAGPGRESDDGDSGSGINDYADDSSGTESGEALDLESTTSGSEASGDSAAAGSSIVTERQVKLPTDEDGNSLVFKVDTTHIESSDRGTTAADDGAKKRDPQQHIGGLEIRSIAKAISSRAEDRTRLQLHVLQGPRTSSTSPDESIRWFHLRSSPMDLTKFKETCLSIPGLSQRLQELVRKMFHRVEKEKLKIFLDGMFIEPGTVLRVDECKQPEPESVIFSCVTFFDLQVPAKTTSTPAQNSRFPSRTLMQSYYPYEPVQDRDSEQAYRKFGNEQRNALIHVPNLWMINIGSTIVATYGHQALKDSFVQSIQIVKMDRNPRNDGDDKRSIRLTDWNGRKLLYNVKECRSYFQMEQRLRELRWCSSNYSKEQTLQLSWHATGGSFKVTPGLWAGILKQGDKCFIDLSSRDGAKRDDQGDVTIPQSTALTSEPFFQWPEGEISTYNGMVETLVSDKIKRSIRCLETVEKAMTSEVLRSNDEYGAVERTFTTSGYYRNLAQSTADDVFSSVINLQASKSRLKKPTGDSLTSHHAVIFRQQNAIAQMTSELSSSLKDTLALFVTDVDKSTMLRKSWAAMQNVCDTALLILGRRPQEDASGTRADEEQSDPPAASKTWYVRPTLDVGIASEPLKKLKRSLGKCRRCATFEMYSTSQAAFEHAQKHFKHADVSATSILSPDDCIINRPQILLEAANNGIVGILTKACQKAQGLLSGARELSQGVLNEDGQMSSFYKLPRSLISALRKLLVFYFAIERAMFYAEDAFQKAKSPFDTMGATSAVLSSVYAIEAFAGGVEQALVAARIELCSMVKSTGPVKVFERLCLSPEYVCGWLMRRLIVKPLEKSMAVSDMYREYLSTIQFQVNHRPGKRLLRSINLLQEEIAALQEVNTQQSRLISNYMSVLDDTTYEKDIPHRRSMFPYERMLFESCEDSLKMTDQEYRYLLARCGPLSDSTKQSLEINEEDHGKAILVFTVVTVIFLPLSFVTSYLGMNTTDIRDMGSTSTLFWAIAIPLTAVTMGSVMYIGYNGDDLRDTLSSLYRTLAGKQDHSIGARGISVAQRRLARRSADSGSALDFSSLADEAEFANPRPDDYLRTAHRSTYVPRPSRQQHGMEAPVLQWETYASAPPMIPEPRTGLRTQPLRYNDDVSDEWLSPPGRETSRFGRSKEGPSEVFFSGAEPYTEHPYVSVYNRTRTRTYNEPISLDVPPPPPTYVRRTRRDRDDFLVRQSKARDSEQHPAPPQYEWTKKSHRHQRSKGVSQEER